jgi:molybdopterin synthase catalytic subunit
MILFFSKNYTYVRVFLCNVYVLGVSGPSDAGKTTLVECLGSRLADRGRVASVKHLTHEPTIDTAGKDTARHRSAGAATTYGITDEDGWFATGDERTLEETLAALAPDYDYALVEGFSEATIPRVALTGAGEHHEEPAVASARDPPGERIAVAERANDVDLDAVLERLHDRDPYETLESLVARVKRAPEEDRAGAIATFTGRVRARDDHGDTPTEHLRFEKYDGVAGREMAAIESALRERDGVYAVELYHRTGVVAAGEDIVFVVVLAGHREDAFRAVEDGIDRLKDEVSLFKKEVTVEDAYWAHDRP